jgi:hypothetical protein
MSCVTNDLLRLTESLTREVRRSCLAEGGSNPTFPVLGSKAGFKVRAREISLTRSTFPVRKSSAAE